MNTRVWYYNKQGEFFLEMGKRLQSQGQPAQAKFQDAIKQFSKAIDLFKSEQKEGEEKNPDAAWSYAHLAEAQRLTSSFGDARDNFKIAIDLYKKAGKENPFAYAHLGECYRSGFGTTEYLKDARENFDAAIKLTTIPDRYIWALAHRGASYDFMSASDKDIDAALGYFKKAIEASGNTYAWAIAFRSYIYQSLALRYLNEIVEEMEKETDEEKRKKLEEEIKRIEKIKQYSVNAWMDLVQAITLDPHIISLPSEASLNRNEGES